LGVLGVLGFFAEYGLLIAFDISKFDNLFDIVCLSV